MDHKAYLSQCWGRRALALLNFKFLGPELNPTAAQAIKNRDLPALPDSQHMHCRATTSCMSSLGDLCSPWISRPEPKPGQILSITGQIWALCVTETSEMCVSSPSFLRGETINLLHCRELVEQISPKALTQGWARMGIPTHWHHTLDTTRRSLGNREVLQKEKAIINLDYQNSFLWSLTIQIHLPQIPRRTFLCGKDHVQQG